MLRVRSSAHPSNGDFVGQRSSHVDIHRAGTHEAEPHHRRFGCTTPTASQALHLLVERASNLASPPTSVGMAPNWSAPPRLGSLQISSNTPRSVLSRPKFGRARSRFGRDHPKFRSSGSTLSGLRNLVEEASHVVETAANSVETTLRLAETVADVAESAPKCLRTPRCLLTRPVRGRRLWPWAGRRKRIKNNALLVKRVQRPSKG